MKIALLIGVSEYVSEISLPACANDVAELARLLSATKQWDDIHCITSGTDSSTLKGAVRAFFAKHQDEDIDQALVYFSGHGVSLRDDALFCCSDFDSKRPSTTSISNAELDDLLRSVAPAVAVKVIDACQSGSPYIKEVGGGFEKALRKSELSSFICMASSRQDQSSYASATASDFTTNLINAVLSKVDGDVFYRDIQSALADAFVSNPDQTPFFVVQGTGLEIFASVNEEMKALALQRVSGLTVHKSTDISDLVRQAVARMAADYVSHDQAVTAMITVAKEVVAAPRTDGLVKEFYSKSVNTDGKLASLPRIEAVAKFAAEQGWAKNYFVKINSSNVVYRVPKDRFSTFALSGALLGKKVADTEFVEETRKVPVSLDATEPLPTEVIEVKYEPSGPGLKSFTVYIGLVHSLTEVMVLSSSVELTPKGWGDKKPDLSNLKWRYQSLPWPEVVRTPAAIYEGALEVAETSIREYLESLASKQEEATDLVPLPLSVSAKPA